MRFDMKKPCKDCPFIKGSCTNKTLGQGRLKSIVEGMVNEQDAFTCHKTLHYEGMDAEQDVYKPKGDEQHCAGAMIYLERINRPNQNMRIAERLGLYDHRKLEKDYPNIITVDDL